MKRLVVLLTPLLGSCFQPWSADGLYRCEAGSVCPAGMTCDDGVCCREDGEPACPTKVPLSGRCASGEPPKTFYADVDEDGYGNPGVMKLACSRPLLEMYVDSMTDCDDASPAAHPGGSESCDGRDNDCDGIIDDGQAPLVAYYRDTDGDGYGVIGDTLMACQCPTCAPPGYAASAGDCAPDDNTRHPMAAERCNGIDDDCNTQNDDNVSVGVGASCGDGGVGECAAATTACVGGAIVCRPNNMPSQDKCDGLDNNCNGVTDEAPDCGGPSSFFDAGLLIGARNTNLSTGLNPPATCLRASGVGEGWTGLMWSGSSDNFHVWYAEAPAGKAWDLSQTGWKLHLQFSTSMLNFNTTPGLAWTAFNQPFVLVCNESANQFSRYRPQNASLLTSSAVTVNTDVPLAGGNGWLLAQGGADLTQVKRIEVVVQPSNNAPMNPSFNNTFNSSSGFRP